MLLEDMGDNNNTHIDLDEINSIKLEYSCITVGLRGGGFVCLQYGYREIVKTETTEAFEQKAKTKFYELIARVNERRTRRAEPCQQ